MAEDKIVFRKSQVALEFIMTYGWAVLVVLVAVGALAYFGVLMPNCRFSPVSSEYFKKNCLVNISIPKEDIVVDSEPELIDVCNRLVVNNTIYPFLEVMSNGLKKENNAQFVIYKTPAELRSDLDIFNVDNLILCSVPIELCYTENKYMQGGTYCLLMTLEVPVDYEDYSEWVTNRG